MKCKPGDENRIMHVHLKTKDFSILVSGNMGDEFPFKSGNNFSLSLTIDEDKSEDIFNALAKEGNAIMPFADVFWGGEFGMLIDQFGIQWIVSTPHK